MGILHDNVSCDFRDAYYADKNRLLMYALRDLSLFTNQRFVGASCWSSDLRYVRVPAART